MIWLLCAALPTALKMQLRFQDCTSGFFLCLCFAMQMQSQITKVQKVQQNARLLIKPDLHTFSQQVLAAKLDKLSVTERDLEAKVAQLTNKYSSCTQLALSRYACADCGSFIRLS
jgi:uncharacterized protein YlxW (UPF0749 family)